MAATQHYLWAGGHGLLLLSAIRYLWTYVTGTSAYYTWWYKTAFFGALISYAIVCYKALGRPALTRSFANKALADENVQYFFLAFFWWFSKPVPIALLPYVMFSLFHILTFLRTTVLPKLNRPPAAPSGASSAAPQQSNIARYIQSWVKSNYDGAMRITAYTELLILLRVVLGALAFQNSFAAPITYAHFMRQRYYHSHFTREALLKTTNIIDRYARSPSLPPMVNQTWETIKRAVKTWGGNTLVPQTPPGRRPTA